MPERLLIVGATSAIAQAVARRLAGEGRRLFLVGRDPGKLGAVAEDLGVRGAVVAGMLIVDLDDVSRHEEILDRAETALGGVDAILVAHGVLGDQTACERDWAQAERVIRTNFLGTASLLSRAANRFERRGSGTLVVISSVAGERGRQSNYVYGASKGALSLFLQGLRNRLHRKGVRVVTVKVGLVDTPMTAHLDKGLLFASPDTVGRGIARVLDGGGDVIYLPWFWRPIMAVIRAIPEQVFKRLRL